MKRRALHIYLPVRYICSFFYARRTIFCRSTRSPRCRITWNLWRDGFRYEMRMGRRVNIADRRKKELNICREGLIKTYALIKLHQLTSMSNDTVAIHSSLFAQISKRNYTKYLDVLKQEMMINIIESPTDNYKDKSGKYGIRQEKNRYEVLELGFDILGKQNRVFPIKLPISNELC